MLLLLLLLLLFYREINDNRLSEVPTALSLLPSLERV